jgi:hypothetical protein
VATPTCEIESALKALASEVYMSLQLSGLAFTRNSLLKKVSLEPAHKPGDTVRTAVHREWCVLHSRAVHIARHSQLYIKFCSDAERTAVRVDSSGCTPVWKVLSHLYSCTDRVIQFVRVHTPYIVKSTHHERRQGHRILRGPVGGI